MKTNITVLLMRVFLVFVFLVGALICLWWYPFSISLTAIGFSLETTTQQEFEFWSQLIFYWVISLPCFAVVLMGFWSTVQAKREGVFSIKTANSVFKMALILFIASVVFLIGNIIFVMLEWNPFALLYFIVGGLGLVISGFLYAVHKYMLIASQLKKENDEIL